MMWLDYADKAQAAASLKINAASNQQNKVVSSEDVNMNQGGNEQNAEAEDSDMM